MALSAVINLINRQNIINPLCTIVTFNYQTLKFYQDDVKVHKIKADSLDDFTSKLIQTKSYKWQTRKESFPKVSINKSQNIQSNTNNEGTLKEPCSSNINELLKNAVEANDTPNIKKIIQYCLKINHCPSIANTINVFSICSQSGDKETVDKLILLCEKLSPQILEENSHFRHYLAEVIWVKGNIKKSLDLFEIVYKENPILRRRIRLMLKYLIGNVVTNRSEAALVNIIRFSETLCYDFNDLYALRCVWQECFLSEWYADQCLALELLEKHKGLLNAIENNVPQVVATSLFCHRTEILYRLMEIFLRHEFKLQYKFVLIALLEYESKCTVV